MDNLIVDDREYFDKFRQFDHLVCYGAGSKGLQTLELLKKKGINVDYFVDSYRDKWGTKWGGIETVGYEEIRKLKRYCIVITTVYSTALEIEENLRKKGEQNPIFFCANPFKSEVRFLTRQEAMSEDGVNKTLEILHDEKSKKIWVDFINWKITGCHSYTTKYTEGGWLEFFDSNVVPYKEDYTYIDIGAYTGDTILRFLAFCHGKFKKILAFEPDETNYVRLLSFVNDGRLPVEKVDMIKSGLWSEEKDLSFYSAGDGDKYESSNFFNDTSLILPAERKETGHSSADNILHVKKLDQFDDLISGNVLMKIDALSSEHEILVGAAETIRKNKPVIVMELGTRYDRLFETVPFLRSLNKDYLFYVRQLRSFDNSRTIMIARNKDD